MGDPPQSETLLRPPADCLAGFVPGLLPPSPKSLSHLPRHLFCFETPRHPKRGLERALSSVPPAGNVILRQSILREGEHGPPGSFQISGRELKSGLREPPPAPAPQEGLCKARLGEGGLRWLFQERTARKGNLAGLFSHLQGLGSGPRLPQRLTTKCKSHSAQGELFL